MTNDSDSDSATITTTTTTTKLLAINQLQNYPYKKKSMPKTAPKTTTTVKKKDNLHSK